MARIPKGPKTITAAPQVGPAQRGPTAGGPAAIAMTQPKAPGGGQGFLINHGAFTDARPPAARGMKKSAGYPSFAKS